MWQLLSTLIAAFVGGATAPSISVYLQRKHERRGLAAALKGEIDAILLIAKKRKFIEGFESDIKKLRNAVTATFSSHILITQNYFEIFSANATKIGSLGQDVSNKVAEAYTLTKSFLEDVESIRVFEFKDPDTNKPSTAVQADYYEQMLDMLKSANRAGEEASIKLGAYLDREETRWYQLPTRKKIAEAETSKLKALQEGNKALLLENKSEKHLERGMDRLAFTADKLREQVDGAKLTKENESQKD